MLTRDESQRLGCACMYRAGRPGYDDEAYCWVRASAAHLDEPLYGAFKTWLATDWPFERTAFPGRDVSWAEWDAT